MLPPQMQTQRPISGFDDQLLAHLQAGMMESVDECYGPSDTELAADFPDGLGVKEPFPDLAAKRMANVMVAAEQGYVSKADVVNLPEHYARFKIEPIRFIGENKLGFLPGNVIKYVLRWDAKDGVQDLYKAKRYLEMMIAFVEGDEDWWQLPPNPPLQRPPEASAHVAA